MPGSLRTAKARVVRSVTGSPSGNASRREAAHPDGDEDEPGPVSRIVLDLVGQDLQPEVRGGPGRQDAAEPTSARSAMSLPAPAVL